MPVILDIPDINTPLKRTILQTAFSVIGIAGYEFNDTPEEYALALEHLNGLMAENPSIPYNQPTYGQGLPEDFSGILPQDARAIGSYLGHTIAPIFGVTLMPAAVARIERSWNLLMGRYAAAAVPRRRLRGTTPRGAGSTYPYGWWGNYVREVD